MPTVKNIVLVHGAWADGSSWSKVIPLLQAKGLNVVAVQNPLTSIAEDVAATNRMINAQKGPVLLVGHSYGGAVITEAGNHPQVAGLVYVAAFAPDEGETCGGLAQRFPTTPLFSEINPIEDGFLLLTEKGVSESPEAVKAAFRDPEGFEQWVQHVFEDVRLRQRLSAAGLENETSLAVTDVLCE